LTSTPSHRHAKSGGIATGSCHEKSGRRWFEFDRPVRRWELRQIVRAGLDAAERSSMLPMYFENAVSDWTTLDGEARHSYRVGNFYLPRSGRQQSALQSRGPPERHHCGPT
jgi:hypothetical protein